MSPRAPCTMGHWVTRNVDDSHIACAVPTPRAHTCTGEIISGRVVGAERWPGVAVLTWCHLAGSGMFTTIYAASSSTATASVAWPSSTSDESNCLISHPMRCEACNVRKGGHREGADCSRGGVRTLCVLTRRRCLLASAVVRAVSCGPRIVICCLFATM